MKNYLDMEITEFKTLPGWNTNFHCFEGMNTREATYLAGIADAYCVLIEVFELHPNRSKFSCPTRSQRVNVFSEKEFIESLGLKENATHIDQQNKLSLEDAYWVAIEDTFNIFQFLKKYSHPIVRNGDKICQHPSFSNSKWAHFEIIIGEEINAVNCEGLFLKEPIKNDTKRDSVYLDEIFGILYLAEGYFLPSSSE